MRNLLLIALPLAGLFLLGCGQREHIRPDFGKLLKRRLVMQRVYTEPTEGNPAGLDSEEASLIHGTYRKNLTKDSAAGDKESGKVLILQEDKDAKAK